MSMGGGVVAAVGDIPIGKRCEYNEKKKKEKEKPAV